VAEANGRRAEVKLWRSASWWGNEVVRVLGAERPFGGILPRARSLGFYVGSEQSSVKQNSSCEVGCVLS
jgi:hypothetical protein